MRARQLIEGASFGPEALRVVGKAFDNAWAAMADRFKGDPSGAEAARLKLANILLSLAGPDTRDADALRVAALAAMEPTDKP